MDEKSLNSLTFNINDIICHSRDDKVKRPHRFIFPIDTNNKLIVTKIYDERDRLVGFVISYCSQINEKWVDVYRVDTAHGFLHEQRFWKSDKSIPLPEFDRKSIYDVFDIFFERIKRNCGTYRELYLKRGR